MLWYVLAALGIVALMIIVAVVVVGRAGRGRLARGRVSRLLRMGRLSARLSTSWFGARVRRLFAGRERRARLDEAQRKANAQLVASTMGEMKGALMKLGQMVSFVTDEVPAEYRAALAQLQSSAPPMPFPLIRDVAERELGRPLERAFARFDEKPLASASIGQVHRAQLPSGEEVAVKVQYPGVAEAIGADLANVGVLYSVVGMMYPALDPKPVVEELRSRITEELDYAREAKNQKLFAARFEGNPHVRIPRVFDEHSTARVLTTEFVAGRRFADVLADPAEVRNRYGEIIYRFVFHSILRNGVFNGDPHPGNYLFDAEGKTVTFLDFGCVKFFPDDMMANWKRLVCCHLDGHRDDFRGQLVKLGFIKDDNKLTTELLYEYFRYFYEPFAEDRHFVFSSEYNSKSIKMVFAPDGKFAGCTKQLNMPPDFVFVNRIQWGVYSILAQLGAGENWHRIHREYLYGDPPATELGRAVA
jgi:predicted unusual protein kinase regulating ubiquinone biosynthesis (AarF/ABC1/UbiB family)